ncbi:hypothetical protein B0T14DRAFT_569592 [Immersiella caudata]|uniref:Uncharacterized protein n=1 Tax=Immersiella caudata TaxID=314043 RepID=A0AA39WDU4_9PEZI|nr:hypothetical protein B0T14DRAFT_569592 [Immersiella caudata]
MKPTFIITLLALGLEASAAVLGAAPASNPDLVARQRGGDRGGDDEPTFTIGRGKGKGKSAKGKGKSSGGGKGKGGDDEERVGKGKSGKGKTGGKSKGKSEGKSKGKTGGKGKSEGKGKGKSVGKGKSEGKGKGGKGKGPAEPVCVWEGHCLGDPCRTYDDCDHDWVCQGRVCATLQ